MQDGVYLSSEEAKRVLIKELEGRYPLFSEFPALLRQREDVMSRLGDIDIEMLCGPDSHIIDWAIQERMKYSALLNIALGNHVVLDGHGLRDPSDLDQRVPLCGDCHAERLVDGVVRCETDLVRATVTKRLLELPGFAELEGTLLDERYITKINILGETPDRDANKHVGRFSGSASSLTYAAYYRDGLANLIGSNNVIFDATNTVPSDLRRFLDMAKATDSSVLFFLCKATEEEIRLNAEARRRDPNDTSGADESIRNYFLRGHGEELESMGTGLTCLCDEYERANWIEVWPRQGESVARAREFSKEKSDGRKTVYIPIGEPLVGKTSVMKRIFEED